MTYKMNILEEIIAYKKIEVERAKEKLSLDRLKKLVQSDVKAGLKPASFSEALKSKINKKEIALIAEVKKASPSKGVIRTNFNPVETAKAYKSGGAACLSVLTDKKYFQGNLNYIPEIKNVCDLPILRKDFIIDPYQIYESVCNQADCVLLIVAALDRNLLKELFELSREIGVDVLTEVHDERELEIALSVDPQIIGINNRDLKTFKTDLNTTMNLVSKYKRDLENKTIVSESGIFANEDIKLLMKHDVYSFLVGESLMREQDIEMATKKLIVHNS